MAGGTLVRRAAPSYSAALPGLKGHRQPTTTELRPLMNQHEPPRRALPAGKVVLPSAPSMVNAPGGAPARKRTSGPLLASPSAGISSSDPTAAHVHACPPERTLAKQPCQQPGLSHSRWASLYPPAPAGPHLAADSWSQPPTGPQPVTPSCGTVSTSVTAATWAWQGSWGTAGSSTSQGSSGPCSQRAAARHGRLSSSVCLALW